MNIFSRVKRLNLPREEYAVFGSSLMDVWGLREADDLGIIATPKLFDKLQNDSSWKKVQGNVFLIMRKGEADITTTQDRPTDSNYCPDRLQLIKDSIEIKGVPFVRIEEVINAKNPIIARRTEET